MNGTREMNEIIRLWLPSKFSNADEDRAASVAFQSIVRK